MSARVAIVLGSDSDVPHLEGCFATLDEFGVPYVTRVLSAHRTPTEAHAFAREAADRGIQVLIAAAGGAAHLAGALAAASVLPVIGIPIPSTPLNGMDSLLSTVQMPPGIPVATVAIGKFGATNAALLAIQIMATADAGLREKLKEHRVAMGRKVAAKDAEVTKKHSRS